MNVKIEYEVNTSDPDSPCIAFSRTPQGHFTSVGKTWLDAKDKLLSKIRRLHGQQAPKPEEIELP